MQPGKKVALATAVYRLKLKKNLFIDKRVNSYMNGK